MLFKIVSSLTRLVTDLVTLPLRMLAKNFVGSILFFALLYWLFWPSSETTQPVTNEPKIARSGKNQPPIIQPVLRVQNGNSRFSEDLLSKMSPFELKHYSDVFYWVMEYKEANEPHRWAYHNIHGTITPQGRFKNNHGHTCRRFEEVLKVHTIQQTFDGMACQKVEGGWCRLRSDSTALCGIAESGSGLFDGLGQKLKNLF